jgi:hypothetical protein
LANAVGRSSEGQLEILTYEVVPEAVVLLLGDEVEPSALVDAPCGTKRMVGTEHHARVSGMACETNALLDEPRPDAKPPGSWFHQEQS